MEQNPYAPEFDKLPDELPVFPLSSAFLLPSGSLPLNIFEPRYKQMIEDAMAGNRLIGMIQPQEETAEIPALHKTGCAGKIIEFNETPDGRYLIKLSGVYRFDVSTLYIPYFYGFMTTSTYYSFSIWAYCY
jgi:Lon protease-like protein